MARRSLTRRTRTRRRECGARCNVCLTCMWRSCAAVRAICPRAPGRSRLGAVCVACAQRFRFACLAGSDNVRDSESHSVCVSGPCVLAAGLRRAVCTARLARKWTPLVHAAPGHRLRPVCASGRTFVTKCRRHNARPVRIYGGSCVRKHFAPSSCPARSVRSGAARTRARRGKYLPESADRAAARASVRPLTPQCRAGPKTLLPKRQQSCSMARPTISTVACAFCLLGVLWFSEEPWA